MSSTDGPAPLGDVPVEQVEHTVATAAATDLVARHLTSPERLALTDAVTSDWRGGRAMLVVAPAEGGGSTLTMMADAPADPQARDEMRVRMQQELERVTATLDRAAGSVRRGDPADPSAQFDDAPVATGLEAIEEDQAIGVREAPFADDPAHRP